MIEGLESLSLKIENLSSTAIDKPMRRAMMIVQGAAKAMAPVNRASGGGALRDSIYVDVIHKGDTVTGICYTNLEYAQYVEFGTGPAGQADHDGISPNVNVAYRQTGWVIPATAMSESDAAAYGFPAIKGKDGNVIGYATHGQRAQPFMYPALKNNRKAVIKELQKQISTTIKELQK